MRFREWLELNEAGFLSGILGRSPERAAREEEAILKRLDAEEAERKARAERERVARDRANYDAAMAILTGRGSSEDQDDRPSAPYSTAARFPSRSASPFDQLSELLGGAGSLSGLMDRMGSRPDRSLSDARNRSDMYDVYYKLSTSRAYDDQIPGLSDSDRDRAISMIEGMFKDEVGEVAFPDDKFVCPYSSPGFDREDYQLIDMGEFDSCAKVLVKGFRGRRTTPARVTYSGMTEAERERLWTDEQRNRHARIVRQ